MNSQRRKKLEELWDKVDMLRVLLEGLRDEEQEYMDNMPENLQASERYERAEDAVDSMDYALDNLSDAMENLEDAIG